MTKKNHIFDIGNVLFRWNPDELVRRLREGNPEFPAEIAKIPGSSLWEEFDRGAIRSADLIAAYSVQFPETYLTTFIEQSYFALSPIHMGWRRLIEMREAGKKIYLLSNLSCEFRDYLISKYPLFSLIDGAIYSCDVRTIKPEPLIYEKLLRAYEIDPYDSCFYDDRPENLLAAEQFGIQGHLVVWN